MLVIVLGIVYRGGRLGPGLDYEGNIAFKVGVVRAWYFSRAFWVATILTIRQELGSL